MEWWSKFLVTPEILFFAFFLDLLVGDPRWLPHPTVGIGKAAQLLEKPLRALGKIIGGPRGDFFAGLILTLFLVGGIYLLIGWLLIFLFDSFKKGWTLLSVYFLFSTIAVKSLVQHAKKVEEPLFLGNIKKARQAVSMIVGRDVTSLSESEVARAALESIAENASDGIVAPMFYATIGGAPLALAYRAANTLDAMYGHRDPDNLYFGRAAARLDDFLNYLPSRLTALILLVAGILAKKNVRLAWQVFLADGNKHRSPNSGWPEATMAGLLNVRLGGPIVYPKESLCLPYLNLTGRPAQGKDIRQAIEIVIIGSILTLLLCAGLNFLCRWL